MIKKLKVILEIEKKWLDVPGPKYDRLPPLRKGERWSYSGVEHVPMNNIHTIQYTVSREGVNKYKSGQLTKPGRVHIDRDNKAYLQDGHHQYVAKHEQGEETMPNEVWRIKKNDE